MSQYSFSSINPATTSGASLATLLTEHKNAVLSGHSGTTRPSYAIPGMQWVKTVSGGYEIYFYTGTGDVLVAAFNTSTGEFVSADPDMVRITVDGKYPALDGSLIVGLTKAQVGLGSVDNTSDADKPVSTAQAAADSGRMKVGLHTIALPAAALVPRLTLGASVGQFESATNKRVINTLDFPDSGYSYAQTLVPMPKSWNKGSLNLRVAFSPSDSGSGNVQWWAHAAIVDPNDPTDHFDRAWGSDYGVNIPAPLGANYLANGFIAGVVAANSGTITDNPLLSVELFRDATHTNDTYTGTARLVALSILYTLSAAEDA